LALWVALVAAVAAGPFAAGQPASATGSPCDSFDPFPAEFVEAIESATGGAHLAVAVEDVASGCNFGFGAADAFPTASTVKVEILGAALLRIQDEGQTELPAWLDSDLWQMIHASDNSAAQRVYSWLGGGSMLQAYGERLGLTNTRNVGRGWGVDETTPLDQLNLLRTVLDGGGALSSYWVDEARRFMGDIESGQSWGVSAGVPSNARVFLKNGWMLAEPDTTFPPAGYFRENSMGLVQLANGRRYTIAIFGNEWTSERFAVSVIEQISRQVASKLSRPREVIAGSTTVRPDASYKPKAGAFRALPPTRILDTRRTTPLRADHEITLDVLPKSPGSSSSGPTTAVALNVTVTDAEEAGYLTVFAADTARPTTSNLNQRPGRVTPNLVTVPVGADGRIRIYSSSTANVIVDVLGRWEEAAGPTSTGRYQQVTPTRVFDSRGRSTITQNGTAVVRVAGAAPGVPAVGMSAVAVNITVTNASGDGYWTVWPTGTAQPDASNLNVLAGDTMANTTLVPVGQDGTISVFASAGGDLLIDIVGWFTDTTAAASTNGLFVARSAERFGDSRFGIGFDRLWSRGSASLAVAGSEGIPTDAVAILGTLTYIDTTTDGFVTVRASGSPAIHTSSANPARALGAWANTTISSIGPDGSLSLEASGSSEMLVDVAGYFTA
jgi:Beta-lactamase enzyme family